MSLLAPSFSFQLSFRRCLSNLSFCRSSLFRERSWSPPFVRSERPQQQQQQQPSSADACSQTLVGRPRALSSVVLVLLLHIRASFSMASATTDVLSRSCSRPLLNNPGKSRSRRQDSCACDALMIVHSNGTAGAGDATAVVVSRVCCRSN